eukprot:TRINITY_DN18750_c0_g1_i1.p1 TRINITY_DN18750_c0_g1~~TRINITY_DN18750_c0_g1_i1.p1  ORF type:complete len:228 (+),score=70.26 TRINITY_DN18750_c0_g1_i1:350-1033(+)
MRQKCEKKFREDELKASTQYAVLEAIQSEQEAAMPDMSLPDMEDMTESEEAFMLEPEVPEVLEKPEVAEVPEVMEVLEVPEVAEVTEVPDVREAEARAPNLNERDSHAKPESASPDAAISASLEGAADHEAQAMSEKEIKNTEALSQQPPQQPPQKQQQKDKDAGQEGRSRQRWSWNLAANFTARLSLPQFRRSVSQAKVAPSGSATAPSSVKDQAGAQTFSAIVSS